MKNESFIREYQEVLSPELVERIISSMEQRPNEWHTSNLVKTRKDAQFFLRRGDPSLYEDIFTALSPALSLYLQEFDVWDSGNIDILSTDIKVQKTPVSGGFHEWHYEQGPVNATNRIVAWSVPLNIVEGGELEFLNQGVRVKAAVGSLVVFPASFTHMHRGNPPLDKDKYIITGWGELNPYNHNNQRSSEY